MLKIWNKTSVIVIHLHIIIFSFAEGNFNLNGLNIYSDNECSNPNGQPGVCISLYYCPTLLKSFLNTPNITDIDSQKFLQNSTCLNGFGPNPFVCCTNEATFRGTSRTTKILAASLLATPDECIGPKTTYYYGGRVADIRDYHWMALLEYVVPENGSIRIGCQGSLINHRYVLTSAQCCMPSMEVLARVRLGEYDLNTDIDCEGDTCVGPVIYVDIEKKISHFEYTEAYQYDIGLLRLAKHVLFDDKISPICLPSTIGFTGSNTGEGLFVAGYANSIWKNGEYQRNFSKKLQVNVPIYDQNSCKQKYKKWRLHVTENNICAGGKVNGDGDNSRGDGGGALMKQVRGKWVIEGIVSAGIELPGYPTIFTRVSHYEDWIIENIEP